jgi:hypothetical protein
MADFLASSQLMLGGVSINGGQLSFTGATSQVTGDTNIVFDDDDSNSASAGDYYTDTNNPYIGYVTIDGRDYAAFQSTFSGNVFIPNSGELDPSSVISPLTLFVSDNADVVNCFLAGTLIAVPTGDVAIEDIAIGDAVLGADGRAVPVRWIGRQTVSTRFRMAERLQPVRVKAGALGGGLPLRDLVLTADHALLVDGLLINAGALVNGACIDWVPLSELGESFTVYHVETEDHDIILAEGTPAETFIDYVGRQAFDNYAEYVALYGEERIIAEMPYPRISTARLLPPALKARLGDAAAA